MIKGIEINNFGGIENAKFDCAKFNIFQGKSVQGKTTILDAIQWAINGNNDEYLIRNGTNTCEVILHSDNGSRIERRLTRGGTSKLFVYDASDNNIAKPQEALNRIYNYLLFKPMKMIDMNAKELNEFITEAISKRLTLTKDQIKQYELEELNLKEDPIAVITKHYDTLYARRTEINRNVKQLSAKMSGVPTKVSPEEVKKVEEEINDLTKQINESIEHNSKLEIGKKNKDARAILEENIKQLEKEISQVHDDVDMKWLEDEILKKEGELKKINDGLAEDRTKVTVIRNTLSKIDSGNVKCPIHDIVVCKTDMTEYKERLTTECAEIIDTGKKNHTIAEALDKEIQNLKKTYENYKNINGKKLELDRAKSMFESLTIVDGEEIDNTSLKKQLQEKSELLAKYKLAIELGEVSGLDELKERQAKIDAQVKGIDDLLKNVIPNMLTLNIKGVTLSKEGIFFQGLPLRRLGDSLKLRLCTAILKDLFPKANLFCLDRLECIDDNSLQKYIDTFTKMSDNIQYFSSYVGTVKDLNNPKAKVFTVENFKVM